MEQRLIFQIKSAPNVLRVILALILSVVAFSAWSGRYDGHVVEEVAEHIEHHDLSCTVRSANDHILVAFHNNSGRDVRLLTWDTPWDQNSDALLVRTQESSDAVVYTGPMLNRGIPDQRSYITIPAGHEATADYSVRQWYSLYANRIYTVSLRSSTFQLSTEDRQFKVTHDCGTSEIELDQNDTGVVTQPLLEPYPDCTTSQKEAMSRAIDDARQVASAAVRDIESNNAHAMQRWFGEPTPTFVVGRNTYSRILDEDELIRCGGWQCEGNNGVVVDYIYDQKLRLCPAWWRMPHIGMVSRSRVETLVHELAHLVDGPRGAIVDWENPSCVGWPGNTCYDYPNSLHLATHCPRCAQRNTDNYVGFAMEAFMRPALLSAIL